MYLLQIYKELGYNTHTLTHTNDRIYKNLDITLPNIINTLIDKTNMLGYQLVEDDKKLPFIHILPKFHKNPTAYRSIIASKNVSPSQSPKQLHYV